MRLKKIAVVVMFLMSFAAFDGNKAVAAKGGPGPVCWPGFPCSVVAKGGPGPMCIPGYPCVER